MALGEGEEQSAREAPFGVAKTKEDHNHRTALIVSVLAKCYILLGNYLQPRFLVLFIPEASGEKNNHQSLMPPVEHMKLDEIFKQLISSGLSK